MTEDNVKRIFIEKDKNTDAYSAAVFTELTEFLGIAGLTGARVLTCFDIEGLTDEQYRQCADTLFGGQPGETPHEESFPLAEDEVFFGIKLLPGHFDQRAQLRRQCAAVLTRNEGLTVKSSTVVVLKGKLAKQDIKKIKSYMINPAESEEAGAKKPKKLADPIKKAGDVKILDGFTAMTETELAALKTELGLSLSDGDLALCRDYFAEEEQRDPTVTEIKVIDNYWSDHCRHRTFTTRLDNIAFEDGPYKRLFNGSLKLYKNERQKIYGKQKRDVTLMDVATLGMKVMRKNGKLANLDVSEEVNASSVTVWADVNGKPEEWLLQFKNETHNHPTEIEPFAGAATCLGGGIRDPLAGRAHVYQAMRLTGCGDPRAKFSETMPGRLPQRKLTQTAAAGYSSYGNQVGAASGLIKEIYHEGYLAKRMELGAAVGAVKKEHVKRAAPEPGDLVILCGGRTGRDGCGAASDSSAVGAGGAKKLHGEKVPKGDPAEERKIIRLFKNPEAIRLIKRCNDFGAGGVSVAITELADGIEVDLGAVPVKYGGLDGTDLAISESQERMAVVVSKDDAERFIELAGEENLEATAVAVINDTDRLRMNWRGARIVDISREFLNSNGVVKNMDVYVKSPVKKEKPVYDEASRRAERLAGLNAAGQKGLSERFDSTIGGNTVLMPFGGSHQLTPAEAMVAKLPVSDGETTTVSIMAYGYDPYLSQWSPYHGAVCAVVESVAKAVAAGGSVSGIRLSFQEYFESLGDDAARWGKPFAALLGALMAQMKLGLASVGGKDSMSGSYRTDNGKELDVPPALISFAVCRADLCDIVSPEFKKSGSGIVLLETPYTNDDVPDFEAFLKICSLIETLVSKKEIFSAAAVGAGGVAGCVKKMALGNMIGAKMECDDPYSARYGSFVIETGCPDDTFDKADVPFVRLGYTTRNKKTETDGIAAELTEQLNAWLAPLEPVFPTNYFKKAEEIPELTSNRHAAGVFIKPSSGVKLARPRVLIPAYPGSTGEYDMKRAFDRAGAEAEIFVIKNRNVKQIEESAAEFAARVKTSQIIALPGGVSFADDPYSGRDFLAALFADGRINENIAELLKVRDGLVFGAASGFRTLLALGLITCGGEKLALVSNGIGRHVSCLAKIKITGGRSPWLAGCSAGDEFLTAVSTGEGRFVASGACIKKLADKNMIVSRFVNPAGAPSADIRHNPTGSAYAVEGLVSEDGRVFGKIGHAERIDNTVCVNVPGEKEHKIFEAGVRYYG